MLSWPYPCAQPLVVVKELVRWTQGKVVLQGHHHRCARLVRDVYERRRQAAELLNVHHIRCKASEGSPKQAFGVRLGQILVWPVIAQVTADRARSVEHLKDAYAVPRPAMYARPTEEGVVTTDAEVSHRVARLCLRAHRVLGIGEESSSVPRAEAKSYV